jgi:hypothetical protein
MTPIINHKLPINLASNEVKIGDKSIIPIVELCKIALVGIFGDECIGDFIGKEIISETDNFGVIGDYHGYRVGFTLNFEEKYKRFQLSVGDAKDMMLDQLQLFDQLRAWGFSL